MKRSSTILISIGAGFVLLAGGTAAGAATGGNFILGKANTETTQATLTNTKGTPLKLAAPTNAAPLKVSNANLVAGLNAQYLSGMTAPQVATGGDGFTLNGTNTALTPVAQVITSTGALPAGTYYVTATALLFIGGGDQFGFCDTLKGSDGTIIARGGGSVLSGGNFVQAAATAAVSVTAGDKLQEACWVGGNSNSSTAYNAGITAIRVLSSSGTAPLRAGVSSAALPGGLTPQGR
ncbi:MAG: hypothetical protein J2P30_14210 [Actinobacteria bacterium]|nr:hypothetical protein [Actinomycetota bacterium]